FEFVSRRQGAKWVRYWYDSSMGQLLCNRRFGYRGPDRIAVRRDDADYRQARTSCAVVGSSACSMASDHLRRSSFSGTGQRDDRSRLGATNDLPKRITKCVVDSLKVIRGLNWLSFTGSPKTR